MSTKEAISIVCRALAIYFLAWFLTDLTYLPDQLFSLFHYANKVRALGADTYLRDYEVMSMSFRLLRMGILFFAIQWFYRAGPSIRAYFLAPLEEELPGD